MMIWSMRCRRLIGYVVITLVIGLLAACGGGGDGGSGGGSAATGISSVGTLSGFGSIYVNGIEFSTYGVSYRVDDEDRFDETALAVGMKLRVDGTINGDGTSTTATRVFYDDDVAGPIDAGSVSAPGAAIRTFAIFGLDVSADETRTVFAGGAGIDTLDEGQKLSVSGYFDGRQIIATRIEKQSDPDSDYELKGTVSTYDGATISLTLQNGVGAGPFSVSPAATVGIPADPSGLFVEITLSEQVGAFIVTSIETEDEAVVAEGEKFSIGGILSMEGGSGLLINGVPFTVDESTEYEPANLKGHLLAGMALRVAGRMQSGVLNAEEIVRGEGDIAITARVVGVDSGNPKNGTVTVDLGLGQSLSVRTGNSTVFVDESDADTNADASFNLGELMEGTDFVAVKVYQKDTTQLIATRIERQDAGHDTRLAAPVEGFVPNVSVTLLGITWTVDSNTLYELNGTASDAANLFAALHTGNRAEVRDIEPNGVAERLHLEGVSASPTPSPAPDPGPNPGPNPSPNPGPVTGLAEIAFSFKLDPFVRGPTYGGELWVSPPTYSQLQHPGTALVVDARVSGFDASGRRVVISPAWIPSNPDLVSVAPDQSGQVLISILNAGQSTLTVTEQGISRDLRINATVYGQDILLVEISQ